MNLPDTKVLIIGARGMLGSDLALVFEDAGELVLWDKEEIDVTKELEVVEKINNLSPQLVINATGYTNVDGAEDNTEMAFKVNAEAVKYLVDSCKKLNTKIVHFSTEYVFDGNDSSGYNESALPNPLNVYGESKAAGEKYILDYSRGCLVRTSWLYGHTPQRGKPRGLNFVDTIIKLASEQAEVKVVNDQYGKLTNTHDLAKAVHQLMIGDYQSGVYHLVNEGLTTWYNVAEEIFKLKSIFTPLVPISSQDFASKVKRPPYSVLINNKFPLLRLWTKALQDYLNY